MRDWCVGPGRWQEDGENQMDVGCNLRVESKGPEIKVFGWSTWVDSDSIYKMRA